MAGRGCCRASKATCQMCGIATASGKTFVALPPARKGFRSGSSPMSHEKAIFDGVRTRLGVRKSREMSPGHFNILEAQSNQQLTDEDQFLGAFRISCFVYRMISWVVVEWAALTNALSIVEFLRGYSWPHFPHVRVRRAVIPVTPRLGLSARRTALRPVCCAAIASRADNPNPWAGWGSGSTNS